MKYVIGLRLSDKTKRHLGGFLINKGYKILGHGSDMNSCYVILDKKMSVIDYQELISKMWTTLITEEL